MTRHKGRQQHHEKYSPQPCPRPPELELTFQLVPQTTPTQRKVETCSSRLDHTRQTFIDGLQNRSRFSDHSFTDPPHCTTYPPKHSFLASLETQFSHCPLQTPPSFHLLLPLAALDTCSSSSAGAKPPLGCQAVEIPWEMALSRPAGSCLPLEPRQPQ